MTKKTVFLLQGIFLLLLVLAQFSCANPADGEKSPAGEQPLGDLPGTPDGIKLLGGKGQIRASWKAVPGAERYELWYGTGEDIGAAQKFSREPAGTSAVITGLGPESLRWYVWVKAKNAAGAGEPGGPASCQTIYDEDGKNPWNTFGTFAAMRTWFDVQPTNTAAAPYKAELSGLSLRPIRNAQGQDVGFAPFFDALGAGRYTRLKLDACTGATVGFSQNWSGNAALDHPARALIVSVSMPLAAYRVGWNFFRNCTSLVEVIIPPNISQIGEFAFAGCTALESVEFPENMTKIAQGAFADCTALRKVTFYGSTPPGLDKNISGSSGTKTFSGSHPDLVYYVPAGSEAAYRSRLGVAADKVRAIQ